MATRPPEKPLLYRFMPATGVPVYSTTEEWRNPAEKFEIEEKIVAMLKTVYDPEIPVNVYDLGLIYKIDVSDNGEVVLDLSLIHI